MMKGVHCKKSIIDEIRVPYPFLRDLPHDHRSESSMQFSLLYDRLQGVLDVIHVVGVK